MINLTLFIQMANLWITYQLLSRIVLKELLSRILAREDLTKRTIHYFSFLEQRIARLQKEKTDLLKKFCGSVPAVPKPTTPKHTVVQELQEPKLLDTNALTTLLITRYKP